MIGSIISDETDLCGTIVSEISTVGSIASIINLIGSVNVPIMAEDYSGNYVVTPRISGQILPTQDKHMLDDLVIDPIPYYEVCNQYGGTTIIIGGN